MRGRERPQGAQHVGWMRGLARAQFRFVPYFAEPTLWLMPTLTNLCALLALAG